MDGEKVMRAKLRATSVKKYPEEGETTQEQVFFAGVSANKYPEDGSDENNTFARFSPSVSLQITIANPNLIGKIAPGDTFYCDFVRAPA